MVRKGICVPMMALCLLFCSCGAEEMNREDVQSRYQRVERCTMEAIVCCEQDGLEWEAELHCEYIPGGNNTVEVLSPETIAGIKAVMDDTNWHLEYKDMVLDAAPLSVEKISPVMSIYSA